MASGTINLGTSNQIKGRITWSSTANGTTANNSTVTATIQVSRTDSYTTTGTWTGALNIGGTTKDFSVHSAVTNSWVTLLSFSITKAHNADGSGECYISGQINGPSETSQASSKVYSNATVTLDTIARQATITAAPNFSDQDDPKITYSNPLGNSATTLEACISLDGSADDIAYRAISKTGTSYIFMLTDAEREVLRKATTTANSRKVRFYVRTVLNGESYLSYLEKTLSIINAEPTLSPSVEDTNETTLALTGDKNRIVKYFSNAKFSMGASVKKNATIKSRQVKCGSKGSTGASGTLSAVESATFTFTVTDSRGNTARAALTKTLVDYVKPTCNLAVSVPTADGETTLTIKGNFFRGSFGTVTNTATVQYRYKTVDGSYNAWKTVDTATISTASYSATQSITGLDYQSDYVFEARITDKLMTVSSNEEQVRTMPVFDWGKEDFNFNVPVKFKGNTAVRWNSDANSVVLSAAGATVHLRPNGTGSAEGELIVYPDGRVKIDGRFYGENKVLWSGGYFMTADHTITLSEAVSAQPNGIVLVFASYINGVAVDYHLNYEFVPKYAISAHGGKGMCFFMVTSAAWEAIGTKYLYISDTTIKGHANNNASGTAKGITYNNGNFVLKYVIGV